MVRLGDKITIDPVYRMVPLSMTLNDLEPGFQGRNIFRYWISQKRH